MMCCSILMRPVVALGPINQHGDINVTQHHNHATRDGLYVDPAFTRAAATALKRDLSFNGVIAGHVYAQPLYIEGGPGGRAMVIAVTESNYVYALDAASGVASGSGTSACRWRCRTFRAAILALRVLREPRLLTCPRGRFF